MTRPSPLLASVWLLGLVACSGPGPEVSEGCLVSGCHAEVEQIHRGGPSLSCVDCHLGDPDAITKEDAHVTVDVSFNPSTPGSNFLDDPSLAELDALPLDVVRFLNPADYRVAMDSCGTSAQGGVGCHLDITTASTMLNRATLAGQFAGGGFLAGTQDKRSRFATRGLTDPLVPQDVGPGFVANLSRLPATPPDTVTDPMARAFWPVYEQKCVECHLLQDGPRTPGSYYSSGCNGCHMVTTDEARAETLDPTQDIEELGHVSTHRFTNLIPDEQCAHCHVSHLGRAVLSRGLREKSEPEGDAAIGGPNTGVEDPEEAVPWPEENYVRFQGRYELYGKPYPFFIEQEDGTEEVDETPPDVHTAAGLGCIDCHNIREAHGDSSMAERMDREIDVRCETCHGRPGERGSLRSDAGLAFNIAETSSGGSGTNQAVFEERADTSVFQRGRFTGLLHPVTQIDGRVQPALHDEVNVFNDRTRIGCELHAGTAQNRAALKDHVNQVAATTPDSVPFVFPGLPAGFTFEEVEDEIDGRLECFACHNSWTVNCYGCHVVRDDRETYVSAVDGETRAGKVSTFGMSVVADSLALGINTRGRISPMVGTSIFFTWIDEQGGRPIDAQALVDGHGVAGQGNVHNPAHHHTVRRVPRDCDGCHPSASGSHDDAALLTAVGLGSGRYTFETGDGDVEWLDRQLWADYDGDGVLDDPAALGLPTHVAAVEPAASTTHEGILVDGPEPGPLDLAAVNGALGNVVLPQRTE